MEKAKQDDIREMRKSQEDLVLITHQYRDVCRQARIPESVDFKKAELMKSTPLYDERYQPKISRKAFNKPTLQRQYTNNKAKLVLYKRIQKQEPIKVPSI